MPIKVETEAPPHDDWMATEPQNWTEQDVVVPPAGPANVYTANEDWANEVQGEWNTVNNNPTAPPATNWAGNSDWH